MVPPVLMIESESSCRVTASSSPEGLHRRIIGGVVAENPGYSSSQFGHYRAEGCGSKLSAC